MLTAFQCEIVAYIGDGDVYCPGCATGRVRPDIEIEGDADEDAIHEQDYEDAGLGAIIRYTAEDEWPGGLWCGDCGDEIVEPSEDYCTEHDGWYAGTGRDDAGEFKYCDHADVNERQEEVRGCAFAG